MKRNLLLHLPLVLGALALAAAPLAAGGIETQSHSWGGYHWGRTSNPFTVKLGDNLSSSWKPYLATASSDWGASDVLDTTIVPGQSTKRCRPTAGRVEVCNGTYGQNGWLGLAQIWLSGGHITQGSVKVNDTYFAMARYNNSAEKQHVVCQEVGHTFGLDHQDESGISLNTCMDYYFNTSSSDTKSTHPNKHDYDELDIIYAHLDSTNTSYAVRLPAFVPDIDFEGPGQWGQLVEQHENGATYRLDLGDGNELYTLVTYAEDSGERPGRGHGPDTP